MLLLGGDAMCELEDDKTASACFIIERGSPYEKGICIPLAGDKLIVGRTTNSFSPDVSFENFLISRKHCCVRNCAGKWTISDLGSKHGTIINGQPIMALATHVLNHGDKITLASGIVALRFMLSLEFEKTLDFDKTQPIKGVNVSIDSPVRIDLEKMTLSVDNQAVSFSVKEWLLLEVLYRHRNKFVSYEEIRKAVWAERCLPDNKPPDVGVEEINVLVYRLRKRLGTYSKILQTVRGRGCILEI